MELIRDNDFVVEMIGVLEPNETVDFLRINENFRHNRVKSETVCGVSAKSDVSIPGSKGCRITVLLLSHKANVGFLGGFRER